MSNISFSFWEEDKEKTRLNIQLTKMIQMLEGRKQFRQGQHEKKPKHAMMQMLEEGKQFRQGQQEKKPKHTMIQIQNG